MLIYTTLSVWHSKLQMLIFWQFCGVENSGYIFSSVISWQAENADFPLVRKLEENEILRFVDQLHQFVLMIGNQSNVLAMFCTVLSVN